MKKLIITLIVLLKIFISTAQVEKTTVDVTGQTSFKPSIEFYSAKIIISEDLISGYNNSSTCYSDLKSIYFKKLASKKIDTLLLKEDKVGYETKHYRKKGMQFDFKTSNLKEYQNLLNTKIEGVQVSDKKVRYKKITATDLVAIKKRALEDAKNDAIILAKAMEKKVVGVKSVRDNNYNSKKQDDYYTLDNKDIYFYLYVTYFIE